MTEPPSTGEPRGLAADWQRQRLAERGGAFAQAHGRRAPPPPSWPQCGRPPTRARPSPICCGKLARWRPHPAAAADCRGDCNSIPRDETRAAHSERRQSGAPARPPLGRRRDTSSSLRRQRRRRRNWPESCGLDERRHFLHSRPVARVGDCYRDTHLQRVSHQSLSRSLLSRLADNSQAVGCFDKRESSASACTQQRLPSHWATCFRVAHSIIVAGVIGFAPAPCPAVATNCAWRASIAVANGPTESHVQLHSKLPPEGHLSLDAAKT